MHANLEPMAIYSCTIIKLAIFEWMNLNVFTYIKSAVVEKKNSTYWKYCKKIYIYLSILCRNRTQNAIKALFMSSIIIMHGAEFYLPLVYIGDILKYKNCVSDFDWMSFHTFPVFFNKFTKKNVAVEKCHYLKVHKHYFHLEMYYLVKFIIFVQFLQVFNNVEIE